jgi:hypothetical protein
MARRQAAAEGIPDRDRTRVLTVLTAATLAAGQALTRRELEAAWRAHGTGACPRALGAILTALTTDGHVRAIGPAGHNQRFRPADADPETVPAIRPDVAPLETAVYAALTEACTTHGRFVSVAEVGRQLDRTGTRAAVGMPSIMRITSTLQRLAGLPCVPRTGRRGDPAAVADGRDTQAAQDLAAAERWPVTIRYTTRAARTARQAERRWWAPTDRAETLNGTPGPSATRAPLIQLIETVRAALGMPPTPRDADLWLQMRRRTVPHDPLLPALPREWRERLHSVARERTPGAPVRPGVLLATLSTPYTTGRTVPRRFGRAPFSAGDQHAARAADVLELTQPATEAALLEALIAQQAAEVPLVYAIVARRRALLRHTLLDTVPADAWPEALATLEAAEVQRIAWCGALTGKGSAAYHAARHRQRSERLREHVAAARVLLESDQEDRNGGATTVSGAATPPGFAWPTPMTSAMRIGTGPAITAAQLRPIHEAMARSLGHNDLAAPAVRQTLPARAADASEQVRRDKQQCLGQ